MAALKGFHTQGHNEIDEGEYLSTSRNEAVLRMFSDGEKETGFIFNVKMHAFELSDFYTGLLSSQSGMNLWDELVVKDSSLIKRAEKLGFLNRFKEFSLNGRYLDSVANSISEHDGFILPGFWSNAMNSDKMVAINLAIVLNTS